MSKVITLTDEDLKVVAGFETLVITGLSADKTIAASGLVAREFNGVIKGAKVGDTLAVEKETLVLKGNTAKAEKPTRKHNPSPAIQAQMTL